MVLAKEARAAGGSGGARVAAVQGRQRRAGGGAQAATAGCRAVAAGCERPSPWAGTGGTGSELVPPFPKPDENFA